MSLSLYYRPHCSLLKVSSTDFQLHMRVLLDTNESIGTPDTEVGSDYITFKYPVHSPGYTGDHWEGTTTPLSFSVASAPNDCGDHEARIEIYYGPVANDDLRGKTVVRTVDADDNGA